MQPTLLLRHASEIGEAALRCPEVVMFNGHQNNKIPSHIEPPLRHGEMLETGERRAAAVEGDGEAQLCFNRANFARTDFNVQRFVELARRRATLDELHNDLRTYLRSIQNSMVQLINDDYAEFLNLSSNLAALKESIEKLSGEFSGTWNSFDSSVADTRRVGGLVEEKTAKISALRGQQIALRNKIALLASIDRLSKLLRPRSRSFPLSSWLLHAMNLVTEVELWRSRIPTGEEEPAKARTAREKCYTNLDAVIGEELVAELSVGGECTHVASLLTLLSLIGRLETALNRVISSAAIRQQVASKSSATGDAYDALRDFYTGISELRASWVAKSVEHGERSSAPRVESFFDRCLLGFVILYLEENSGTYLVPSSDGRMFHRCFMLTVDFITKWPSSSLRVPATLQLLKSIRSKFNMPVYFKLETQEARAAVKKHSTHPQYALTDDTATSRSSSSSGCICPLSRAILSAIDHIFSPEVYLPPIADKAWSLVLKFLSSYADWAKSAMTHFNSSDYTGELESWKALVILSRDMGEFDRLLADRLERVVLPKLGELAGDAISPLRQCVSIFSRELVSMRDQLRDALQTLLAARVEQGLSAVSDIPRSYRWTRRAAPTTHSPYLDTSFALCEQFSNESTRCGWKEDEVGAILAGVVTGSTVAFCAAGEKVLELVEQTGSSLQRFKKKMTGRQAAAAPGSDEAGAPGAGAEESDDSKIRSQLILDAQFVRRVSEKYSVGRDVFDRLDSLQARARDAQASS